MRYWAYILISITALLAGVGASSAQVAFDGELGLDLASFDFDNKIIRQDREYSVNRLLFNQYLTLGGSGPFVSRNLGSFSARGTVTGTLYKVKTDTETTSDYFNPRISALDASMSLFSARRYPLLLFYSKGQNHNIRYEASNRTKTELQNPELAVVRRYESDLEMGGGLLKVAFNRNMTLTSEIRKDKAVIEKRYDFQEDKDIFVEFQTIRPNPGVLDHTIQVTNTIGFDTVLVFVDLQLVDSVFAGQSITFTEETGSHEVDIVPLNLNPFRATINVEGDMIWKVIYTPPVGTRDMDMDRIGTVNNLVFGGNGRFHDELFFELSSTDEAVQDRTAAVRNLVNNFDYALSPVTMLRGFTNISSASSEIGVITSQKNSQFIHQTMFRHGESNRAQWNASHSYTHQVAEATTNTTTSDTHILTGGFTYPIRSINYIFDIRSLNTFFGDNSGRRADQYTIDMENLLTYRMGMINWEPRNKTRVTKLDQENPNNDANEFETRFALYGDVSQRDLRWFGDLRFGGEYDYRVRDRVTGQDSRNRYLLNLGVRRKMGTRFRVSFDTTHEKQAFSDTPVEGGATISRDELRQSLKLGIEGDPINGINLGGQVMFIKQEMTKITRYSFTLTGRLPRLGVTFRSFLNSEQRTLQALSRQTNMTFENRIGFRIRRAALTFSHSFISEDTISGTYSSQQILAVLSRRFDIKRGGP